MNKTIIYIVSIATLTFTIGTLISFNISEDSPNIIDQSSGISFGGSREVTISKEPKKSKQ